MPELPEVETTLRGISPHITGRTIQQLSVRQAKLRQTFAPAMQQAILGQRIGLASRRGKYILVPLEQGTIIIHLGMSGSLRMVPTGSAFRTHDHIALQLSDGQSLRFHDPRRFGLFLWEKASSDELLIQHPLLRSLGPEPLTETFSADYLFKRSRSHCLPVKSFIMDSHVVVGVGNIYASESLFMAGIHPLRACNRISLQRYAKLVDAIVQVLQRSINLGGTTLRDFVREDGQPGYFSQSLQVYGRQGKACYRCGTPIKMLQIGQRSSYYCAHCQH